MHNTSKSSSSFVRIGVIMDNTRNDFGTISSGEVGTNWPWKAPSVFFFFVNAGEDNFLQQTYITGWW